MKIDIVRKDEGLLHSDISRHTAAEIAIAGGGGGMSFVVLTATILSQAVISR